MKKLLFVASIIFALAASGQFKPSQPVSVQQYFLERAALEDFGEMTYKSSLIDWSGIRPTFAQPRLVEGIEMIDAFIDITGHDVIASLKAMGIKVNCEFDGFVTAQIPMTQLEQVHMIPGVTNVEISRIVELCSDSTLKVTHAGQVLNGREYGLPRTYDGTGVVVGIIDYGFDFKHIVFKGPDGKTNRIKRVYNSADTTGHPVIIGDNAIAGSVFMGEQLDTMTTDDANGYHGTHTACLAAGTHYNGYGGMAPGADIVLCAPSTFKWGFMETEVINSIKYVFAYADSVKKPCVISMSVSTSFGPHDGSDRLSKAIRQLVGPGKVFVIAAGNNADKLQYSYGKSTLNKSMNMLFGCYNYSYDHGYYYDHIQIDSWVRAKNTRPVNHFFIFDKWAKRIVWRSEDITLYKKIDASEISDYYVAGSSSGGAAYLEGLVSLNPNNAKFCLSSVIHNLKCKSYTIDASGYISSRYQIGVAIDPPYVMNPRLADSCYVDSWMYTGNGRRTQYDGVVYVDEVGENGDTTTRAISNYFRIPSDAASIGTYAIDDSIISAGGFAARRTYYCINLDSMMSDNAQVGAHYRTSSYEVAGYGPTGKALPTVMAPGFNVVSAVSRYNYYAVYGKSTVMRLPGNHNWGVLTGTSMAAPTVAGIIAEWLQINPNLSPGDIKYIISKTAIKDEFTSIPANASRYGPNGKIDAMAGARYILSHSIIPGDVNGDGRINIEDLTVMLDCKLGTIPPGTIQGALDFDQDGLFDMYDFTLLIDYLLVNGSVL